MFIWAESRKAMKWYSRSRSDFLELLYAKYFPMEEEILGCLWTGEENTDYQLCNWDSDLLPTLIKKDEIRFEYNQANQQWSKASCTIFAAVWMLSDLMNYEFSLDEIKEIDELSYTRWRTRWKWWYVQKAVKLVADRWNEKMERKVAYYRLSKYDNDIIEDVIDKLYTIDWNFCPTADYINDYTKDWMLDGTKFWYETNWHSVDIIKKSWQRSVKDNYKGKKYNVYGLKNKLSAITNFWAYFYVYVPVEDKLERIKKLNKMKALILNWIQTNSDLWNESGSQYHKDKVHEMNNFYREWLNTINEELKKLS